MKLTSKTALSIETTVDIDIELKNLNYRFRVLVQERPGKPAKVRDIEFRDKHDVFVPVSVMNKLRKFIRKELEV